METYRIIVDEENDAEMYALSLVDKPAFGSDVSDNYAFSEKKYSFNDEVNKMITGVVVLADTPVSRGDHNVVFFKEDVKYIMLKSMKDLSVIKFNEQHNQSKPIGDMRIVEMFLIDSKRNQSVLFPDAPEGSLVATVYFDELEDYNRYANDPEFKGFSMEITTPDMVVVDGEEDITEEEMYSEIINVMKKLIK